MEEPSLSTLDQVDMHYRTHIGDNVEYVRFQAPRMGILEWPRDSTRYGVHFYATLALHRLVLPAEESRHRFELFTGVRIGDEAFRLAFAKMANDVISDQMFLEGGHLVTPFDRTSSRHLRFGSWLMIERLDGFLPPLTLGSGDHVTFLDATPVFKEEADLVRMRGTDALFEIWDEFDVRPSDLSRALPSHFSS